MRGASGRRSPGHLLLAAALTLAAGALAGGAGTPPGAQVATIKRLTVSRVAQLTGPGASSSTRAADICGTDLGTMTEVNGRVLFAFGDSFGFQGEACPRFGPNWRSNLLGVSSDLDPSDGVTWERWLMGAGGHATAVREGAHQPAFTGEQTRIPTAMVTVRQRVYLHLMSVHGFAPQGGVWQCNSSGFVFSDDEGRTWKDAGRNLGGADSPFNMLALTAQRGGGNERGGYVYALGTPCGRFGDVRLARVRPDAVAQPERWEYFTGLDGSGQPQFVNDPSRAAAVIRGPVGEASVLWNPYLGRWMYTYLNEGTAALELREARVPWGPWSAPHTLATAADYPQLYGAFMTPAYLKDGGRTLYFVMSQFGPYNTFVMKASIER
ncbi:DUF4185 domain-containing protein [Deinococcus apachensis]|uniref:DUF4185 domain-containing protein n=1 Tax=Deinococcus apachensis TaxID=309886 RepID=UPI00036063F5|nr:DUF4185 domain-containing protein [Deinococcus apachensis]